MDAERRTAHPVSVVVSEKPRLRNSRLRLRSRGRLIARTAWPGRAEAARCRLAQFSRALQEHSFSSRSGNASDRSRSSARGAGRGVPQPAHAAEPSAEPAGSAFDCGNQRVARRGQDFHGREPCARAIATGDARPARRSRSAPPCGSQPVPMRARARIFRFHFGREAARRVYSAGLKARTSTSCPPGRRSRTRSKLLNMRHVKHTLEGLRKVFNWVILDTPPLLFSADANLLSTLTDGTLIVVRIGSTTYDNVIRAMQTLCENNVLGIVANGARAGELYSKYTYYYSKTEDE